MPYFSRSPRFIRSRKGVDIHSFNNSEWLRHLGTIHGLLADGPKSDFDTLPPPVEETHQLAIR
jgi:hypothetical protein